MRALLWVAAIFSVACGEGQSLPDELVLVALEGEGTVAVVDASSGDLVHTLAASALEGQEVQSFAVHNVQAAEDGRTVLATAPRFHAEQEESCGCGTGSEHAHAHGGSDASDQLLKFDLERMALAGRIDLGAGVHPAHVVLDGVIAYVSQTARDEVAVVDTETGALLRTVPFSIGTAPHGLRLSPDRSTLFVAGMGRGSLEVVDLASGEVESHDLPSGAVQVAVLADGSAVLASIQATQQIARLDLAAGTLSITDLPPGALGPVQLYPAPDSRHVWVADQGMLQAGAVGTKVYRVDALSGEVDRTVEVGGGPHGVVVSRDGGRVWVTLSAEGALASLDAESGELLSRTSLGRNPNGVSFAFRGGAMP